MIEPIRALGADYAAEDVQIETDGSADAEREVRLESWWDRSLFASLPSNWESVSWFVLFLIGSVARFYNLGVRAMSHDESLHALYSYYLYNAGNYEHNPMMHGPLQFHITALVYFLVGHDDATARLVPALMGIGVIGMALLFRRYVGKTAALLIGILVTISPSLLFHSRYIRDDIYIAFFTMVWIYGAFRYLDGRDEHRFRWLVVMVMGMAFGFVTMENHFIHGAIIGSFFAGLAIWQVIRGRFFAAIAPVVVGGGLGYWVLELGQGQAGVLLGIVGVLGTLALLVWWLGPKGLERIRLNEPAELAVVMATMVLPFLSPFVHLALGWDPMAYASNEDLARSAGLVLFMVALAVGVAYYWFGMRPAEEDVDGHGPNRVRILTFGRWAQLMGGFWLVQVLFFTTFLTNTRNGLASGIVGSLGYWLGQQEVKRGGQPWYYYPMIGTLYEFLPLILSIGAFVAIVVWLRRTRHWEPVSVSDLPVAVRNPDATLRDVDILRRNRVYFIVLVVWWTIVAWLGYTAAGEKMPWLLVHMALPMCVLGGWWLGRVLTMTDWTVVRRTNVWWLGAAAPAALALLITLIRVQPFAGRGVDDLASTMQWMLALLLLGGLGYLVWRSSTRVSTTMILQMGGLGLVVVLLVLTVRTSYRLTYINYDMATEYLVYAHASPDIKRMYAEIDLISERTVGERNITVAYDDDTSWPLSWYMRLYPNSRFYGATPTAEAMSAPVIIVGPKNYDKVRPYVARDYVKRTYRLVWWPDQGYFNLTWPRVWSTLTDARKMENIYQIVVHRRFRDDADPTRWRDLTKWPTRHEYEVYIRRDIAEQVWNLNVTPLVRALDPQEELLRTRTTELSAMASLDARTLPATELDGIPLLQPRAVAAGTGAWMGRRVIADTGNHRVVVVNPDNSVAFVFGTLCRLSEGEAGGCVDPDGDGPLALGDGQFNEPWGVAIDGDGSIYVADTWNGRIQVFDAAGNFLRKWGYFNTTQGQLGDPLALFGPRGLAIDATGNLLVADTGNKRILQFTPEGELLRQAGGGGPMLGNYEEPTAIAVDPNDGSIFVADAWNRRIQKLDVNLVAIAEWPVNSWGSQNLWHKPYLTVAGNGDVYASDPENYRVLVFNSAGGLKGAFGSFGLEMNRFGLPNGLAWDVTDGTILVADADNQRVLVFPALP